MKASRPGLFRSTQCAVYALVAKQTVQLPTTYRCTTQNARAIISLKVTCLKN